MAHPCPLFEGQTDQERPTDLSHRIGFMVGMAPKLYALLSDEGRDGTTWPNSTQYHLAGFIRPGPQMDGDTRSRADSPALPRYPY